MLFCSKPDGMVDVPSLLTAVVGAFLGFWCEESDSRWHHMCERQCVRTSSAVPGLTNGLYHRRPLNCLSYDQTHAHFAIVGTCIVISLTLCMECLPGRSWCLSRRNFTSQHTCSVLASARSCRILQKGLRTSAIRQSAAWCGHTDLVPQEKGWDPLTRRNLLPASWFSEHHERVGVLEKRVSVYTASFWSGCRSLLKGVCIRSMLHGFRIAVYYSMRSLHPERHMEIDSVTDLPKQA